MASSSTEGFPIGDPTTSAAPFGTVLGTVGDTDSVKGAYLHFELRAAGLAQESEGAVCLFLDGFESPMIVRKKDGAFLYATTDLATIRYRMERWKPDAVLYVVDQHAGACHTGARTCFDDDLVLGDPNA